MKKIYNFITLLFFISQIVLLNPVLAMDQDELLKPEEAFQLSVKELSPQKIEASWKIADGYYMYRERFAFESESPGITLGNPVFPKGKIKDDPGFGKVETFQHSVSIEIPVTRNNNQAESLNLKTTSQGCAEIGVCYPPQKQTVSLQLAAANSTPEQSSPEKKTRNLAQELGITGLGNANQPLHPDEAFAFDISASDKQTLVARWRVTPGHYLYQDKIKFSIKPEIEGISIGEIKLPEGKQEHDEYFGDIVIYNKDFEVRVPLQSANKDLPENITLKTSYQGCSKLTGICYPPQNKTESINLASAKDYNAGSRSASNQNNNAIQSSETSAKQSISSDTQSLDTNGIALSKPAEKFSTGNNWLDESLNSDNFMLIILATLVAGLALAFTACMYPMIPILSSIIVGQGKEVSALKGLSLSAVYVLSLAVTFGIIGAITASVAGGIGIQAYFQNPWVLTAFALLFIALAFSMFGFYDIQIPAGIQNKLSSLSNKQEGGSLIGVAIMGALSALIIGPCGGPILAAILSYAAVSASMLKGFAAMFALGLGMGLPLLLVGAGGGKILPKAGNWMSSVKAGAGVILLAVSLIILERMPQMFPPGLTMILWSLLLIVSGVYLGAFSSSNGTSGWGKLWRGLGLAFVIYGALVMIGGVLGGKTVTDPFYGINLVSQSDSSGNNKANSHVSFKRIKSLTDLQNEIAKAKQQGKPVMLDFYADWCTYCIKFERYVFPEPSVKKYLDDMVLLQADVTATDDIDKELMSTLGISLPPAILLFDKNGKEISGSRTLGYKDAESFSTHLGKFLDN